MRLAIFDAPTPVPHHGRVRACPTTCDPPASSWAAEPGRGPRPHPRPRAVRANHATSPSRAWTAPRRPVRYRNGDQPRVVEKNEPPTEWFCPAALRRLTRRHGPTPRRCSSSATLPTTSTWTLPSPRSRKAEAACPGSATCSPLVAAVVRACSGRGRAGATVKIRIGIDAGGCETATDAALSAQKLGAAALTLRAQTSGTTRDAPTGTNRVWKGFARRPVGNGDVFGPPTPWRCWSRRLDGVSVGRGARGHPWIFRDIVAAYNGAIPAG